MDPRPLDDVLEGQPRDVAAPSGALERIRRSLDATRTLLAVFDDDPTGPQVVRDVPVITRWTDDDVAALFDPRIHIGFVLTNSRSLDEHTAVTLQRDVARRSLRVAGLAGRRVEFVSRSDSTLRGHFPSEPNALADVARANGSTPGPLLLCPAYPEAGRITVDGTHWVRVADGYVPAAASEFAADPTFGYRESFLPRWVEERSGGRTRVDDVQVLTLGTLRGGGAEPTAEALRRLPPATTVVADAVTDRDLVVLALAVALVREDGMQLLHRCGPSLLAPLSGQRRPPPLTVAQLTEELRRRGPVKGGGIVVVGSHTHVSSMQLHALLAATQAHHVEVDVEAVLNDAASELDRVIRRVAGWPPGEDVVISTSRTRRDAASRSGGLAIARAVSQALVALLRRIVDLAPPAYIVAKGGITSSDLATQALDVRSATVIGQMIDGGLPVWRLPADSRCPGLPYVVFPGNVGSEETLASVVATLSAAGRAAG